MSELLRLTMSPDFSYAKGIQYARGVQWPAFWISMLYVVVIFSLKAIMANRKPLEASVQQRIQ